jgi:hypothetical protein
MTDDPSPAPQPQRVELAGRVVRGTSRSAHHCRGLIENLHEVEALFTAGVNSVSVSNPRLWII